ncbi:MAG TPA: hypothetical protein VGI79_14195 [Caulobacteraceae bacterium]|jgi:hypothetical protein
MIEWIKRRWQDFVQRIQGEPKDAITAQLIASKVDFDLAMEWADMPEIRKIDGATGAMLKAGRASRSVVDQIGAAITARLILATKMSDDELVRYVQHLQNRYAVAVGPAAYARYAAGIPKNVFDDYKKLWAELQTLSYRLRLAYSITHMRDKYLYQIRTSCFTFLSLSLAIILVVIVYQQFESTSNPVLNFMTVATVGFGGALTSIARRANQLLSSSPLEDDPVIQASAMQQGRASLFIAALTGPIFALTLLLIFMTTAFNLGDLTPKFHEAACDAAGCGEPDFRIFKYAFWLDKPFDAAKLATWAFISGFAEQFVPDVLDRFATAATKKG